MVSVSTKPKASINVGVDFFKLAWNYKEQEWVTKLFPDSAKKTGAKEKEYEAPYRESCKHYEEVLRSMFDWIKVPKMMGSRREAPVSTTATVAAM